MAGLEMDERHRMSERAKIKGLSERKGMELHGRNAVSCLASGMLAARERRGLLRWRLHHAGDEAV